MRPFEQLCTQININEIPTAIEGDSAERAARVMSAVSNHLVQRYNATTDFFPLTDRFVVLPLESARQVYISHKTYALGAIEDLVKDEPLMWLFAQNQINSLTQEIELAKSGNFPPANVFTLQNEKEKPEPVIVFVDPNNLEDDYGGWSFGAAVAEETTHLHSQLNKCEYFNPTQKHAIEELAVKYYVYDALTAIGLKEDAEIFNNKVGSHIELWRRVIDAVGEVAANDFYFRGKLSSEHAHELAKVITTAVQTGLVK